MSCHSFVQEIALKWSSMSGQEELTKRSDVTSVHIGAILVPLPDDLVDEPAVDG